MAKVGNEARLILRLAEERIDTDHLRISKDSDLSEHYKDGFADAVNKYKDILFHIVRELEG